MFYYLLELDPLTVKYYPQPILVPYQSLNQFVLEKNEHVPDTLAFRQGFKPHLYQVKGGDTFIKQKPHLYQACVNYCRENGWNYSVVYPKSLPSIVKRNIHFIMHYMQPRPHFNSYISEVLEKVSYFKKPTIEYIARSFVAKTDFRDILPVVYHLIFLGELRVDLLRTIDQFSEVTLGDLAQDLFPYFNMEGDLKLER